MTMDGIIGKHFWLIAFAHGVSLLVALPVRGQPIEAKPAEIKAVVRISKKFIEDVAAKEEISATIPYNARVLRFNFQGMAEGKANLSVEMNTSDGEAAFIVNSRGTAHTYARGVRGPIVALAPVCAPFTARSVVRFDGRKFSQVETTPSAHVHIELDRIEGRRGGVAGRVVGRLARPLGQLLIPRAEAQATPIGESYLKNFVDELAEDIVTKLNRKTPVEKSLNRLYPETKDWIFRMSSDAHFIQAAYGPRGAALPVLPENPGRLKDVRIELWMHTTSKEAQDLAKLSKQPLAKNLVHKYLETVVPELAALTENRSVDSVGEWLVISVGAPKEK
jgi:hypothetical protein